MFCIRISLSYKMNVDRIIQIIFDEKLVHTEISDFRLQTLVSWQIRDHRVTVEISSKTPEETHIRLLWYGEKIKKQEIFIAARRNN